LLKKVGNSEILNQLFRT